MCQEIPSSPYLNIGTRMRRYFLYKSTSQILSDLPYNKTYRSDPPSPSTLDIQLGSWESEHIETVAFRSYNINSTTFGSDPAGTKVGEVVVVAKASWGGELDMLIIVRPLQPPNVDYDGIGEEWIRDWLNARG